MGKYYCPKCTLIFDDSHDRCPNCGYYSIYCLPYEKVKDKYGLDDGKEIKPDFDSNYIKKLCDSDHRFTDAIDNYNRLDLLRYNGPLVDDKNNFCVDVHSFTRDVYYEVRGCFNKEGDQLVDYHCQCNDYLSRRRCCKHIIVLMMKIYHVYCEQNYGVIKELMPKKSTAHKKKEENIKKPSSNNLEDRKAIQLIKEETRDPIVVEPEEFNDESDSSNQLNTLKHRSLLKHLLCGLLISIVSGFLLWGVIYLSLENKKESLDFWWMGFVIVLPICLFCVFMMWRGKWK